MDKLIYHIGMFFDSALMTYRTRLRDLVRKPSSRNTAKFEEIRAQLILSSTEVQSNLTSYLLSNFNVQTWTDLDYRHPNHQMLRVLRNVLQVWVINTTASYVPPKLLWEYQERYLNSYARWIGKVLQMWLDEGSPSFPTFLKTHRTPIMKAIGQYNYELFLKGSGPITISLLIIQFNTILSGLESA